MKVKIVFYVLSLICCTISAIEKKDIEGDCAVTDPVRNYTFDFRHLGSELGYHLPADEDHPGHYLFNICKKLSNKCNNQTDVGACYVDGNKKEFVIGYDSKINFSDGQILFAFTGEKCDDKRNYTTNVVLHCDYSFTKNNDFLGVFPHNDQCSINIWMHTPFACLPLPEHVKNSLMTVVTPNNKILNFKSLQSSNHEVHNGDNFHIGFPVLYGHNLRCEAGTSICYVNSTAEDPAKMYVNMGAMTSNFKYDKGRVVLKLTSNEICSGTKKFSSEIVFDCDDLIEGDGYPELMGIEDCVNKFRWQTSLACANDKPCQLSTVDGQFYDFSSLSGTEYRAVHPNKTESSFYFSICKTAKYGTCGGNVGSCIVTERSSGGNFTRQIQFAGNVNSTLQIDDSKNIFLKYENGAKCADGKRRSSTKIEFIIADDREDEEPVLVEEGCDIVIHFKTLLANSNVKNCIVKTPNDEEISLSALIDFRGNYVAKVNEKSLPNETNVHYLLNVCRPLNSNYSLNCHGNTAACRTKLVGDKYEEELSLGHFDYSMSTEERHEDNTTAVIMKYFKGSKCPTEAEENIVTTVKFFCDETAGLGNPILQSIEHCEYVFDFPTNILCKDRRISMKSDGNSCELLNEKLNVTVNMRDIGIFEDDSNTTKVDICASTEKKSFTINYRQSMISIKYQKADNQRVEVQLKCSANNNTVMVVKSVSITSSIRFNKGILNIIIGDEILVRSESVFICPILNIAVKELSTYVIETTTDNNIMDDQKSSDNENHGGFSIGYLILSLILVIAFGTFYLVLRNPERREILRNMVKFRSRSRNVRYSRVNVNEESVLLDNGNNYVASESDDEDILA